MKQTNSKKYLALFDLDGTLFDTTEVNYLAYKYALENNGDFVLDKNHYITSCNGKHYKKYLPDIINSNDSSLIEKIHNTKKICYSNYLYAAKKNIHLFQIIKSLRSTYYTAIVTTASKKNTMDILKYFQVEELFDLIITHEDVKNVKPNPEGFLTAMDYFHIPPNNTLIFEDSDIGVEAAISSNATVFKIENFQ